MLDSVIPANAAISPCALVESQIPGQARDDARLHPVIPANAGISPLHPTALVPTRVLERTKPRDECFHSSRGRVLWAQGLGIGKFFGTTVMPSSW